MTAEYTPKRRDGAKAKGQSDVPSKEGPGGSPSVGRQAEKRRPKGSEKSYAQLALFETDVLAGIFSPARSKQLLADSQKLIERREGDQPPDPPF